VTEEERPSSHRVSRLWWLGLVALGAALLALIIVAWDAQLPKEHVGAVGALVALVALLAAGSAVLLAWPEYAEWRDEHHRDAGLRPLDRDLPGC
jgi:peptidoglycan/LPS O-acetylase OafA/YrhL